MVQWWFFWKGGGGGGWWMDETCFKFTVLVMCWICNEVSNSLTQTLIVMSFLVREGGKLVSTLFKPNLLSMLPINIWVQAGFANIRV